MWAVRVRGLSIDRRSVDVIVPAIRVTDFS